MAADKVLGRFGMDMKTFVKSGKRRFTESAYAILHNEIREVKLGCEFLVAGFDAAKHPHIFTVSEPGIDSVYDKPGFCSIGTGKWAAEGMLYYRQQTVDRTLHETVLNVCAAKFMAERIPGVGETTFLFVKKEGCNAFMLESWVLPTIRAEWEKTGAPRIPDGLLKQIEGAQVGFYFKKAK